MRCTGSIQPMARASSRKRSFRASTSPASLPGGRGQHAEGAIRNGAAYGRPFAFQADPLFGQAHSRISRHAVDAVVVDGRSGRRSPGLQSAGHQPEGHIAAAAQYRDELSGAHAPAALRHERQRESVRIGQRVPDQSVSGTTQSPLRGPGLLAGLRTRPARQRQTEAAWGPLVLAIDTTHEFGSLALLRGTETVDEVLLHAPTGFAHVLYPQLSRLLDRNGIALGSIDCFAAASGPGSFTGVRVGLA